MRFIHTALIVKRVAKGSMRTLVPRTNKASMVQTGSGNKIRGFTLIEILVVLLIVSIMSGVVLVKLPGFAQTADFDAESRRLKILLDLVREESIVQASEFGFKPTPSGYAFFIYNEGAQKWFEYEQAPFRPRTLPGEIALDLSIEGERLSLSIAREGSVPPLLLLSSGEVTPFTLTIFKGREIQRSMGSDGYGDIQWLDDDDK